MSKKPKERVNMSEVEQVEAKEALQEWIEARKTIDLKLESIREYIESAIQDVKEYHKSDPNWFDGLEDSLKFAKENTYRYQNYEDNNRPEPKLISEGVYDCTGED